MSLYAVVQFLIVAAAVGWAAWSLARRLIPKLRGGAAKSAGCADCSGGGCCDSPAPGKPVEKPLRFHRD